MALKLKSVQRDDPHSLGRLNVVYELSHASEKSHLVLDVSLSIAPTGPVQAHMDIQGPDCHTTEEALDRLAEWLERSAEAIRQRPKNWIVQIPLYPE